MYLAYGRETLLEIPALNPSLPCAGSVWWVTLLQDPLDVTQPPVRVQFIKAM
jgi:hypothetical protein